VALEHDVEATSFRLGDECFGLALILETRQVGLEPATRIVAQLDARKAGGIGAVHDRCRGGPVTPVPEDGLEPAQWLRLDALERDEEAFAASLALEVDSHVEGVDASNDDPEAVAALDDVGVDKSACGHLSPECQSLLVGLAAPEDGLQAADELESSACLLRRHGIRRRAGQAQRRHRTREPAGQAQRRHRTREPAGQASQRKETCRPHGAQSYQTPRRVAATLNDSFRSSSPMPALPASALIAGIASRARGSHHGPRSGPDFLAEWRGPESNRRHHGFQPCALPTELPRQAARSLAALNGGSGGCEPLDEQVY